MNIITTILLQLAEFLAPKFAMPRTSTEGAVQAVNNLLHLHPDDQPGLLEVIQDYFTSDVMYEETDADMSDDSEDDNGSGRNSGLFFIKN